MSVQVTVPRLGWSMDEGAFVEWLKQDGEHVSRGDLLFVLEGDKAAQEIESFDEGTLRIPPDGPRPGDVVKVGQVIGFLTAPGESISLPAASRSAAAADSGQPVSDLRTGVVENRSVRSERDRVPVTPRARRVARELGIDVGDVAGSGRGGRVRERDVRALADSQPLSERREKSVAVTGQRRTIAERMFVSLRSTAPVTLTTRVNAANLVSVRRQFQSAAQSGDAVVPSLTDLLVKITATALLQHPLLNSRWERERIALLPDVHIGVAVDTDTGLLVPVIRDVLRLGVKEIAQRLRSLIDKARRQSLSADEQSGGTFTITNLGMFGVDGFTPILNTPETAILGVGAIRREAIVTDDDRIVPAEVLTLSLTFDHRVVDGAPAARFLQDLAGRVENAAAWLIG